jgi:hypothetical protein
MWDGYKRKSDTELERIAWHAANLMNIHLKRKVTAKQLLGKDKKVQSDADKKAEFKKLQRMLKQSRERE